MIFSIKELALPRQASQRADEQLDSSAAGSSLIEVIVATVIGLTIAAGALASTRESLRYLGAAKRRSFLLLERRAELEAHRWQIISAEFFALQSLPPVNNEHISCSPLPSSPPLNVNSTYQSLVCQRALVEGDGSKALNRLRFTSAWQRANSSGYILFEQLITSLLVTTILALLLSSLKVSNQSAQRIEAHDTAQRIALAVGERLHSSEWSTWWIGVKNIRVQPPGRIVDAFNQPISGGPRRISPESTAVSLLRLAPKILLRRVPVVRRAELRWPNLYCIEHQELPISAIREALKSSHFIALSLDGYAQVRGQARLTSTNDCPQRVAARVTTTLSSPQLFSSFPSVESARAVSTTALIPITDSATIYLDQNSTLRLLSHAKNATSSTARAGQPLAYRVQQLLIISRSSDESHCTQVELNIETIESKDLFGRASIKLSTRLATAEATREIQL